VNLLEKGSRKPFSPAFSKKAAGLFQKAEGKPKSTEFSLRTGWNRMAHHNPDL
jgi:hypothetical protein